MARTGVLVAVLGVVLAAFAPGVASQTGRPARVRRAAGPIVRIAAGEFLMGSGPTEIHRAVALCAREPGARDRLSVALCIHVLLQPGQTLCDPTRFDDEAPRHPVWLPAFGIDRTEVTVAAYDHCVRTGACRAAAITLGSPQLGGPTQPAVGVSWDDAVAFCRSVGGRLPTEAEWERAASGRDGRPFPWGWQFDPRRANHGVLDPSEPLCTSASRDGYVHTAPVGSFPDGASADGVLDLAGNAWEWVADYWHQTLSSYPTRAPIRRVAPRGAPHGAFHIARGGAYNFPAYGLRTTFRWARGVLQRDNAVGFRCAYDL
jgi:sulfatase modifying factor 1